MVRVALSLVLLGTAGGAAVACASNSPGGPAPTYVGGACSDNRACAQLCAGGTLAGMCTLHCTNDLDCPTGASCIDTCPAGTACTAEVAGFCAVTCTAPTDCSSYAGNACAPQPRMGASGSVSICQRRE